MHKRSLLVAALLGGGAVLTGASTPIAGASDATSVSQLTYVGCDTYFAGAQPPRTRINLGPGEAPLGRRSLGLVPSGLGTASGPALAVPSLAAADLGLMVSAADGTTGVSYVWTVTAELAYGTAWLGTAALEVPAGQWQAFDARDVDYHWQLVDLSTTTVLGDGGVAPIAGLVAEHGDGPGYVVAGWGCDGHAFNVDALRAAGEVTDFEGLGLSTSIAVEERTLNRRTVAKITGTVTDPKGRRTGDPLVLQTRAPGGEWRAASAPTLADRNGVVHVLLPVDTAVEVRWYRPESQYADAGWSDALMVGLPIPLTPEVSTSPGPDPEVGPPLDPPSPEDTATSSPAPPVPVPAGVPQPSQPVPVAEEGPAPAAATLPSASNPPSSEPTPGPTSDPSTAPSSPSSTPDQTSEPAGSQ